MQTNGLLGFFPPERPKRRHIPSNNNFDHTNDPQKIPTSDLVTEVHNCNYLAMVTVIPFCTFQPLGVPIIVLSILFVFMCLMYSFGK